jgi:hypothetical protein
VTSREKMQLAYELAFFPPRLNQMWREHRAGRLSCDEATFRQALDDACRLHLALPETGYASQRAFERLATYQARSRAYGMPRFIRFVRAKLGEPPVTGTSVPGHLVRDIALPLFHRDSRPPEHPPKADSTVKDLKSN